MSVSERIATLELQIREMVSEISSLKIQVGDSDVPLFDASLFGAIPGVGIPASPALKEVFVLFDFETGGKFYDLEFFLE